MQNLTLPSRNQRQLARLHLQDLSVEAEVNAGPWTETARAGRLHLLPGGNPHQIRNTGTIPLEFVVVAAEAASPAGLPGYSE